MLSLPARCYVSDATSSPGSGRTGGIRTPVPAASYLAAAPARLLIGRNSELNAAQPAHVQPRRAELGGAERVNAQVAEHRANMAATLAGMRKLAEAVRAPETA